MFNYGLTVENLMEIYVFTFPKQNLL